MSKDYYVTADIEKNRLYITLGDIFDESRREEVVTEIWEKAQTLNNDWGCVVDYTKIENPRSEEDDLVHFSDAMQVFKDLSIGRLVRVVNTRFEEDLKLTAQKIRDMADYEAFEVNTLSEANEILDMF